MNNARPLVIAASSRQEQATAVLLGDEQQILRSTTCPMCHTPAALAQSALEAGGDWWCVRCGQRWDAARLVAVAAYAAWAVDHDRVASRGSEGSRGLALDRDPPTERPGGAP